MPKRKGFLYEWMCDKEHIREAIVFGAKDKHDRRDVRRVLADVDGYTDRVYDLLQTQTFAQQRAVNRHRPQHRQRQRQRRARGKKSIERRIEQRDKA